MRAVIRGGRLLLLGLAMAACVGAQVPDGGGVGEPLAGTAWQLAELNGQPPFVVPGGGVPTLAFAADGARASGTGGCNQFGGPYTQEGATLRFGALASTRRACVDEAANRQETAYLRALESATRFTASGELLVLFADGQPVARFRRSGG
jgi:heat shock protein HslJ